MVLFIARHRSHVTLARGWETEVAVTSRVPLVVGLQAASPPPDEFLFVQLAARPRQDALSSALTIVRVCTPPQKLVCCGLKVQNNSIKKLKKSLKKGRLQAWKVMTRLLLELFTGISGDMYTQMSVLPCLLLTVSSSIVC